MSKDINVLYIEDNPSNVVVVSRITENLGYNLIVRTHAEEGIDYLHNEDVDLVLMDIGLPDIDGLEATEMIRQNPAFKHLPIIAITASAMVGDRERCLKAGCNDYLAKPFQVRDLVAIFNQWLQESSA